jgi:hypothetical protein
MANNVFNFDAPKGSSVAFGTSLLGNIRKRTEERENKLDKFGNKILGVKLFGKGLKWSLENQAEDFNRSNLGVYNRLDGLIKANQKVLNDELAIKESGGTSKQYFSQKFINTARDEATKNNRLFDYSGTKQAAQTFSIEAAKRHKSLYEKAKSMSVNIEDYKDVAQDTVQIPENTLDFIGFKVKNLFKEKDPRIAALKQDGITLEAIAQLKQNGIFDNALQFESMLKGMPSAERDKIIEVIDTTKEKPTGQQTTFQLVEDETTGKKGYKAVTVVNYADPDDTKIIEGKAIIAPSNLAYEIYTDTRMNAFRKGATAAGMREFEMLVAAQHPVAKDKKSFAGGLQHLRSLKTKGKDILEEIFAVASSKEEYITYEIGESSPERDAMKATIKSLERVMDEVSWELEEPEQRKDLAKTLRKIIGLNRYMTSKITSIPDIEDEIVSDELNKLDDDTIIGYINMLRTFGETADVALSGSGMKP